MSDAIELLFDGLGVPSGARVEQRVTKALLQERGGLGLADRRLVEQALERLTWRATLKPGNTGLAAFSDEQRDYAQVVVMTAHVRAVERLERVVSAIHRVFPHPLVLVSGNADDAHLSISITRLHEREAQRVVVERVAIGPSVSKTQDAVESAFLDSLPLATVPAHDLWSLQLGWEERIETFAAARLTGVFRLPRDGQEATARRQALAAYASSERELSRLRKAALAEKRLARRLDRAREVASAEGRLATLIQTLT